MTRSLPGTWAEVYRRLGYVLGSERNAWEWVRQALGCDPAELSRARSGLALQKVSGVLLALEEERGDLAFVVGQRQVVARAFARYFGGVALPGPPWRVDPTEPLPSYDELAGAADFGEVLPGGGAR